MLMSYAEKLRAFGWLGKLGNLAASEWYTENNQTALISQGRASNSAENTNKS